MTGIDTEKAAPLSLLAELTQSEDDWLAFTDLLRYLIEVRRSGHTGQVILHCHNGKACEFEISFKRRLYK